MIDVKVKKLSLYAATALALACMPANAATITIKVGVDSAFATTAGDLISAFQSYYRAYGYTYSVVMTASSSATLESDIVAGGATGPYDLFLSGGKKEAQDLVKNYPSLVVGTPFKYAKDFLALYSPSVDVSAGLPYPLTTDFVLPDPTSDVYGAAASEVLAASPWSVTTIPSGHAVTRADAGTVFAAIDGGSFPYGFLANSQICSLDDTGKFSYPVGTYSYLYKPNNDSYPSDKLVLKGVTIALTRTADQETELANFIAFLTGAADAAANATTRGVDVILSHCFKIPATP
jgi:molybdate transport system substrate-binding protein